ncbi:hypothetical protein CERZMDRAFT_90843 [Cercospora zeae-maydis SCOH1-5]|uniref:Uncharacterized protein n=1 Tax=Cercospora zeae-maydis SCOH1-5 TaxID=717836 RepID=A0A6A6FFD2_9PEZI|nr:hypothetical protein CERZMDRAFT_90843 [Cercospora zeae-maydis SCOH1-5]
MLSNWSCDAGYSTRSAPLEVRMVSEVPLEADFGSTHVNRRGELASDSEDGSPLKSPVPVDIFLSPEKRSLTREQTPSPRRWNGSPTPGPHKRSKEQPSSPIWYEQTRRSVVDAEQRSPVSLPTTASTAVYSDSGLSDLSSETSRRERWRRRRHHQVSVTSTSTSSVHMNRGAELLAVLDTKENSNTEATHQSGKWDSDAHNFTNFNASRVRGHHNYSPRPK